MIRIYKRLKKLKSKKSFSILYIVGLVQNRVFRDFRIKLRIILGLERSNIIIIISLIPKALRQVVLLEIHYSIG